MEDNRWDASVDLVVVGSGVGGLTAAIVAHDLGLTVMVVEKASVCGGSSAMSGGTLWVPCNAYQSAAGIRDSEEQAWRYLMALTQGEVEPERLRAFLKLAPRAVADLERRTLLRFELNTQQPDYHPELRGSLPGGRSLNPRAFDGRRLGEALYRMRPSHPQTLIGGRIGVTALEARSLLGRGAASRWLLLKTLVRYGVDLRGRWRSPRDRRLTMGNALIGPLRLALLERKLPLQLDTRVMELVTNNGRIAGLVAEHGGKTLRIAARRGVLLASGGFARNQSLRERYLPAPTQAAWSAASPDDTGDGLHMAQAVGAATAHLDQAWWTPTVVVPGQTLAWILVMERSRPGCLLVDGQGKRFASEGLPYEAAVRAIYAHHGPQSPCVPAWLVFDARYRHLYPCGPVMPGYVQSDRRVPDPIREQLLIRAPSLRALAERIEVPAAALERTVARFNEYAARGEDPDFHKGQDAYSRYYGDPTVSPNPCLRPVTEAPFYAVPVVPGDLGTKGGVQTDASARVLDEKGEVIPGLLATGNCTASVMGTSYPGAGATLAPSLTFGWIAAHTVAGNSP